MPSLIEAGKETAQDINTYIQIGKWSAILGTGYMLHKNRRVGLTLLARQGWAVTTAAFRLAIQIGTIWYEEVVLPWRLARAKGPGVRPPPVELVKNPKTGRYQIPAKDAKPVKNWRPWGKMGGGGATAFALFGGILVNAIVEATEWLQENTDFSLAPGGESQEWEQIR